MDQEGGTVHIRQFSFAALTALEDGHLRLCKAELEQYIRSLHPQIVNVETVIISPGEPVRIMPVRDVIEPRTELDPRRGLSDFRQGEETGAARAMTLALKGIAVVTSGRRTGFDCGHFDMRGPRALNSRYSALRNLVLRIEVGAQCDAHQHEVILRRVGLMTARWIADQVKDSPFQQS